MNHTRPMLRITLVLAAVTMGLVGSVPAQIDPCAGASGAAYGLCTAYCVHMQCGTSGLSASQEACRGVAASYMKLTGAPILCATTSASLSCTCSDGILSCSASGLEAGVVAFLNIDLTAYNYGQNGVGDALTDANGNVQFPDFDVFSYLAARNLTLTSVVMQVTNQAGMTLAQAIVPTCPR
jgi:hypothetical protein